MATTKQKDLRASLMRVKTAMRILDQLEPEVHASLQKEARAEMTTVIHLISELGVPYKGKRVKVSEYPVRSMPTLTEQQLTVLKAFRSGKRKRPAPEHVSILNRLKTMDLVEGFDIKRIPGTPAHVKYQITPWGKIVLNHNDN